MEKPCSRLKAEEITEAVLLLITHEINRGRELRNTIRRYYIAKTNEERNTIMNIVFDYL
jgi:hypothetical protein